MELKFEIKVSAKFMKKLIALITVCAYILARLHLL